MDRHVCMALWAYSNRLRQLGSNPNNPNRYKTNRLYEQRQWELGKNDLITQRAATEVYGTNTQKIT